MSIRAIPNQPIAFDDSRFTSCWNDDPAETLLVHVDDDLSFQVEYDPCDLVNLVDSPSFEDPADYNFYQFTFANNTACNNGVNPGTSINTTTGFGTAGNQYLVRLDVRSITTPTRLAGITVSFGGQFLSTNIRTEGSYQWVVTALSGAPLTVSTNTTNTGVCLSFMGVYEITPDLTVDILDSGNNVVTSWGNITDPTLFTFTGNRLTFSVPVTQILDGYDQVLGCHRVRITDACDNSTLTSQVINIGEHDCALQLKVCNTDEGIGFDGFAPVMRVMGKLSSPRYEYEVSEERLSDGTVNRPFADRRQRMELRIDGVGEYGHRFLSTLPLWDHFYIDRVEYIAKPDTYEPGYGDVYDATGSVSIAVEPKRDLARKVRATEDLGGCQPPPLYLVQGTGPNEDYVTQTDGSLILINL